MESRPIGRRVQVRLHANHLEVYYRGVMVARPGRVRGTGLEGIDYLHVVKSLIRKPGAYRLYVNREAMFPTPVFRRAYDVVAERSGKWADLECVRILHLAATTMECEVEAALAALLESEELPEHDAVLALVAPLWAPFCLHGPLDVFRYAYTISPLKFCNTLILTLKRTDEVQSPTAGLP